MSVQFIPIPQSSPVSGRARDFLGDTNLVIAGQHQGKSPEEIEKAMTKPAVGPSNTFVGEDLVAQLIKDNPGLWKRLLQNNFCMKMKTASGADQKVLDGFKWYMRQDYLYCFLGIEYEVQRAPKAASVPDFETSMERVGKRAGYSKDILKACTEHLGIKYSDVLSTHHETALDRYIEFLLTTAKSAPNWVVSLVAMIPCIQSYYQIAVDLKDNSVHKDTVWYNLWAYENAQYGPSTERQKKFFSDNTDLWKPHYSEVNKIFQDACDREIALWDTALTPPS